MSTEARTSEQSTTAGHHCLKCGAFVPPRHVEAHKMTCPGHPPVEQPSKDQELRQVCDCGTKDALVCKEHPDCRPSYCKMRQFDPPVMLREQPSSNHQLSSPTEEKGCGFSSNERSMSVANEREIGELRAEVKRLRAALVHIGEQASEGVFTEHGDCPATYACSTIIAELIHLGMPPKGVVPADEYKA